MVKPEHIGPGVEALVDFTQNWSYDKLSSAEVEAAKECLIDTIGVGIEGGLSEPAKIVKKSSISRGGQEEATILGTTQKVPLDSAVRTNGVMVRSYDLNDAWIVPLEEGELAVSGCHPSENIPPALAVAEKENASGEKLIAAICLGYELAARLVCMVTEKSINERGYHHGTWAGIVTPLVSSFLKDLDREKTAHALGIGSTRGAFNVIDTMSERPNNATKSLAHPEIAAGAVLSTEFAQKGYTGPISSLQGYGGVFGLIYGDNYDEHQLNNQDSFGYITDTQRKIYPADGTTQGTVHSIVTFAQKQDINPDEIESINVYSGRRCHKHTSDPHRYFTINEETADHSLAYLCSVACLDQKVDTDQFRNERYRDSDVIEFSERLSFDADSSYDTTPIAGRVEVQMRDGTEFVEETIFPPGHKENSLSYDELCDKFRQYWERNDMRYDSGKVIESVENLEQYDEINEIITLFQRN